MFEIFGSSYNIVALDYCAVTARLSALHFKTDSLYYVTIIDIGQGSVLREISMNLRHSGCVLDTSPGTKMAYGLRELYENAGLDNMPPEEQDTAGRAFSDVAGLYCFKVDQERGTITLFIYAVYLQQPSDGRVLHLVMFNLDGEILSVAGAGTTQIERASLIGPDRVAVHDDLYSGQLEIFAADDTDHLEFELHEEMKRMWNNRFIEYFDDVQSLNGTALIGFTCHHATAGFHGAGVCRLNHSGALEGVYFNQYNYEEAEGPYAGLALDSTAQILYTSIFHYDRRQLDIRGYALAGAANPARVITVPYRSAVLRDFGLMSDERLGIVLPNNVLIYELSSGRELVSLPRDEGSPYFIGTGMLAYFYERKLMIL